MRAGSLISAVVFVMALAGRVGAQSASDKAAAEGLFDQGRAAMRQGDFAQACGLLERSERIDPAVGTMLYLAECYEKSGRPASAWATFRGAADAADAAREPVRARTGRERAARLEAILSRLTIRIDPENEQVAGLSIARKGEAVQPALWNVPVPVDPGEYAISASAPGRETWWGTVTVPERAASVSITVPPLRKTADGASAPSPAAENVAAPAASAEPSGVSSSAPATSDASEEGAGARRRTIAYVVGGAGIAGVAIGSIFGVRAITKNSDAESHCPGGFQCKDAQGVTLSSSAKSAARVSNVAFAIGGAALVGGVVLFVTAPKSKPAGASVTTVQASIQPGGVVVEGSF